MSVVHDSLQSMSVPERKWHLRGPDGAIYGPVSLPVLCEWAAQSRIVPGNEVSCDGITWAPAQNIPELKMEWAAVLPDGSVYGPFNVLAVPHLYQNGVIPSDARIENRTTGKTLHLADMLKSKTAAQASEEPSVSPVQDVLTTEKEKTWEQMYREEKKARLISEAKLQETIQSLKQRAESSEELIGKLREETEREHQELQLLALDRKSKEQRLKDGTAKVQTEIKNLKQSLDFSQKEASALKKENEALQKAAADNEAKLRAEIEQWKKGQESAAAERQNISNLLLTEQKKTRDLAEKNRRLTEEFEQAKAGMSRSAADAQAQLERLKKELDTQKTLHAEFERSGTEKEAAMFREAHAARSALAEAEHEIAALRRNNESLAQQTQRKIKELEDQNIQLKKGMEESSSATENLKSELHSRDEGNISLRNMVVSKDTEIENIRNQLKDFEAHYDHLKQEATVQIEETAKATESMEAEHKSHLETRLQFEQERNRLNEIVNDLKASLAGTDDKARNIEGRLEEKIRENQELARQVAVREEKINSQAGEFKKKLEQASTELEEAKRALAQETERSAVLHKQAAEKAQRLARELEEARQNLASQKQKFDETLASEQGQESFLIKQVNQLKAAKESADALVAETTAKLAESEKQRADSIQRLSNEKASLIDSFERLRKENESLRTFLDRANKTQENREKELNDKISELSSQLTAEKSKLAEAEHHAKAEETRHTESLTSQSTTCDRMSKEIGALNEALNAARVTLAARDEEITALKHGKLALASELEQLRTENRKVAADNHLRLNALNKDIEAKNELIAEYQKKIDTERKTSAGVIEQMTKAETRLHLELEKQTARYRELEEKTTARQVELGREIAGLQDASRISAEEHKRLNKEMEKTISDAAQAAKAAAKEQQKFLDEIKSLRENLAATEKQIHETTAEMSTLSDRSREIESSLKERISKLESDLAESAKASHHLETQVARTTEENRNLVQENTSFEEEIKDALAQIKQLRKQTEPLSRKIQEQEYFIRNIAARAEGGALPVLSLGDLLKVKWHGILLYLRDLSANIARSNTTERKALIAVAFVLVVICVFVMFRHTESTNKAAGLKELDKAVAANKMMKPEEKMSDLKPLRPDHEEITGKGKVIAWPGLNIDADKAKVSYGDNVCTIVFNRALFSTSTNLSEDAAAMLGQVATSLKDSFKEFSLIVEGHSAGSPADAAVSALDSYALGMARAEAVRSFFRNRHDLPGESIFAVSAGDSDQPFPENDPASQARNRTVVLKLMPKQKSSQ